LEALWRLDVTLGSVLATGSDPMISRIRLAWWREALERLDREKPPAEPMLETVSRDLLPAGVSGAELAGMEEGWLVLTEPGALSPTDLANYSQKRGGLLFRLGARLLGEAAEGVEDAGARWALADLARRSNAAEAQAAFEAARLRSTGPAYWPRRLRSLGMLAALAERDIARGAPETQGSPGRIWRMLRHRLTGR
jgi:phytoene synthase